MVWVGDFIGVCWVSVCIDGSFVNREFSIEVFVLGCNKIEKINGDVDIEF